MSSRLVHVENSIIEIFQEKLLENPYLHEIAQYFKQNQPIEDNEDNQDNILDTPDIEITPIRVSTITVLCKLGIDINLDVFFQNFTPYYNEEGKYRIVSMEYMDNTPKGIPKQKKKKQSYANTNLVKKRTSFYNQITIIMDYIKSINLKLFRNGSIHITGIIDEEQGKKAVEFLGNEIRAIYAKDKTITNGDINLLGIYAWDIVLINSDFACNFKIRREKLYEIIDSKYNLVVNYESDSYPGVKTSFYWSEKDNGTKDSITGLYDGIKSGICKCKIGSTCKGKGRGTLDPEDCCRKITISIFQSGKIIITGARAIKQVDECYKFIICLLKRYYHDISRQ
jgi:TATA-box binding protein (TBP) (component of TFIID and TFIIIB)